MTSITCVIGRTPARPGLGYATGCWWDCSCRISTLVRFLLDISALIYLRWWGNVWSENTFMITGHCRSVLKNVDSSGICQIIKNICSYISEDDCEIE